MLPARVQTNRISTGDAFLCAAAASTWSHVPKKSNNIFKKRGT